MQDAFLDPECEQVVLMTSSQVGKTEIVNNVCGFFIHHDPSPILVVQPTLEMGESWSKDRLAPMIRDTPVLAEAVGPAVSRASSNTLRHKNYPGGQLTIAGANSAAGLAMRPIRVLLADEIDRYPHSAGTEGDPVDLARKRTSTYWNRVELLTSTPTVRGLSRIEAAYESSSAGRFHVPCRACGAADWLRWANVRWSERDPKTARYVCPECDTPHDDYQLHQATKNGRWVHEHPERRRVLGFHVNELYSPWRKLEETVAEFLRATAGGPEQLKVFVNTALGETWEEEGAGVEPGYLYQHRREHYDAVPAGAEWLTAGVDVQANRIECELVAWGADRRSWSMDYRIFFGDPRLPAGAEGSPWNMLDELLEAEYLHADGPPLRVARAFVDSGAFTDYVYAYTAPRQFRGVFACKGQGGPGHAAIAGRAKPGAGKRGAVVFSVGVDGLKATLYSNLGIDDEGPGYCAFPLTYERAYFDQLTAERLIRRYRQGRPHDVWEVQLGRRNEALDCRVYAMAALEQYAPARTVTIRATATARASESPPAPGRFSRRGLFDGE